MSETTSQTSSMGASIVIAIFMTGSGPSPRATRLPIQRSIGEGAADAGEAEGGDGPQAHQALRSVAATRTGRCRSAAPAASMLGQRPVAVAGGDLDRADGVDEHAGLVAEGERVEDGRPDAVVRRQPADHDPPDAAAPQEPVQLRRDGRAGQRVAHREAGVAVLAVRALADRRPGIGDESRVELRAPRAADAVDGPRAAVLGEVGSGRGMPVLGVGDEGARGAGGGDLLVEDREDRLARRPRRGRRPGRRSRSGRRRRGGPSPRRTPRACRDSTAASRAAFGGRIGYAPGAPAIALVGGPTGRDRPSRVPTPGAPDVQRRVQAAAPGRRPDRDPGLDRLLRPGHRPGGARTGPVRRLQAPQARPPAPGRAAAADPDPLHQHDQPRAGAVLPRRRGDRAADPPPRPLERGGDGPAGQQRVPRASAATSPRTPARPASTRSASTTSSGARTRRRATRSSTRATRRPACTPGPSWRAA